MTNNKQYTLGEWMDIWLQTFAKAKRRESTVESYIYARMRFTKHYPDFENRFAGEISTMDFQDCFNDLSFCSRSSLTSIKAAYSGAYKKGIRENICTSNPLLGVEIPSDAHEKTVEALTAKEQEAFEGALKYLATRDHFMLQTFLLTGLRRSELQNLRWSDWDVHQKILHIRESKTDSGIREVPVLPEVSGMLFCLRAVERSKKEKCEYIFSHNGGKATDGHIRHICTKTAQLAGIRHVIPHMLRHTFATRLIEKGADAKSVSMILGHANVEFTLHRYVTPDNEHLQAQMMLLSGHKKVS